MAVVELQVQFHARQAHEIQRFPLEPRVSRKVVGRGFDTLELLANVFEQAAQKSAG
jgi:hypothetical protein